MQATDYDSAPRPLFPQTLLGNAEDRSWQHMVLHDACTTPVTSFSTRWSIVLVRIPYTATSWTRCRRRSKARFRVMFWYACQKSLVNEPFYTQKQPTDTCRCTSAAL